MVWRYFDDRRGRIGFKEKNMTFIRKTLHIFPFIILFLLTSLLAFELFHFKPYALPSPLLGENVPPFHLQNLFPEGPPLTNALLRGRVVLLNVWATWCAACSMEHAMLLKINQQYHVPIYSIDYKDDAQNAIQWLQQQGNPYALTGQDNQGDAVLDLGVYGTPETFVIGPAGNIVYRQIGPIDQKVWDETLYPLIQHYQAF
jgi:cytochrome c biogenesis protein CcmG/thiol:disulfide interchange protein DsbE